MIDRLVRVIPGIILIAAGLYWSLSLTNWLGWIVAIIGLILLVTGAVGTCPIYKVLDINTNKPAIAASPGNAKKAAK